MAEAPAPSSPYLVGPLFDCVFFLYSPAWALVLGIGVSHSRFLTKEPFWLQGRWVFWGNLLIGTLIAAHLVLVVVRSHGNPEVFARHPWRFTLVPALLFVAFYSSLWLSLIAIVVSVWWDVYHSSMQTFGLARLYERKAGNDPEALRSLDKWVNLLLYAGPILAGATLANHLRQSFGAFQGFELKTTFLGLQQGFFTAVPAQVQSGSRALTWAVIGVGAPLLLYYVYAHWRAARQGHRISKQKVLLLVVTGATSIYTWGFNTFGEAFFIMNFFHALQYFAIVWWVEGGRLQGLIPWPSRPRLRLALVLGVFLLLPLAYGAAVTALPRQGNNLVFCVAMVVSLMHFWYDGFIWSVRKNHV